MLGGLFTPASRYTRAAFWLAILWTIGIFVACLWPGKELPHSDIPFIDKWTHFVLFGMFAFLWLCAYPRGTSAMLWRVFIVSVALGVLVEFLQMALPDLGRSGDVMDAVADAVGGLLGTGIFRLGAGMSRRRGGFSG